MSPDTFIGKIKPCLSAISDISWNSVQTSNLRALARDFEEKLVLPQEVPDRLRTFLPSGTIDRKVEACIIKALR